uniref:hypothetical protein n=1 Tax=Thaumasiovibrio occultus TaxID=1891184 RepID=UPI000B356FA7|nr:hypothetical protein [Thaumasiovibrio occultus]
MNYLSRENAKARMVELALPAFFADVIDEKLSAPLSIYMGCPTLYYLSREEQHAFALGDIIPLWEDAGGYRQYAYDIINKDYIAFEIEDGEVSNRYSWDSLIASLIDALIEHEYDDHANLEQTIAAVKAMLAGLNLHNFDELVASLQGGTVSSHMSD